MDKRGHARHGGWQMRHEAERLAESSDQPGAHPVVRAAAKVSSTPRLGDAATSRLVLEKAIVMPL